MHTSKFILSELYCDPDVLEELQNDFGVDIESCDVTDALYNCCGEWRKFGSNILLKFWDRVIEKYNYVLDSEKFDCDVSSPSYPCFYYNGESVSCAEDLDKIAEACEETEE